MEARRFVRKQSGCGDAQGFWFMVIACRCFVLSDSKVKILCLVTSTSSVCNSMDCHLADLLRSHRFALAASLGAMFAHRAGGSSMSFPLLS